MGAGRVDGCCKRCLQPVAPDQAYAAPSEPGLARAEVVGAERLSELLTSDEAVDEVDWCLRHELGRGGRSARQTRIEASALLHRLASRLSSPKTEGDDG